MKNKRILLVEDEEMTCRSIERLLLSENYDVITANDGFEALNILKGLDKNHIKIDLLITDINMPRMTGIELLEELKNIDMQIPVIVITAIYRYEEFEKNINKNIYFLEKPFGVNDLISSINKCFKVKF
jgi:DNA-binding NtrC family response regulator